MHILTNMHRPPTEGKVVQKPVIATAKWHKGYYNNGDKITNRHSILSKYMEVNKKKKKKTFSNS